MAEVIKKVTCGDTTTIVYKTRPKWYLAGKRFISGALAVIISSVITYVIANVTNWLPAQYEPIVTGILIPLLLYAKKYISMWQADKVISDSDCAEEAQEPDKNETENPEV